MKYTEQNILDVYNFIKASKIPVNTKQIAEALHISQCLSLICVNRLQKRAKINLKSAPLSTKNKCSCYYH